MLNSRLNIPGLVQSNSSSPGSLASSGIASSPSAFPPFELPGSFLGRFSVNQVSCVPVGLDEAVEESKRLGMPNLGLLRQNVHRFGLEKAVQLLDESRVRATSYSWACGFSGSMGFTFKESIQDGCEVVREAAQLGAKTVIAVTGSRNRHTLPHWNRIVQEALRVIGDEAQRHGISLAVMPMSQPFECQTFLNRLDTTLDLLDELSHPSVGLAFDAYHWCEHPKIAKIIADVTPFVRLVQLSDRIGAPSPQEERLLPGAGFLPLAETVKTFLACNYAGSFELAVWSKDLWRLPAETCWHHGRQFAAQVYSLINAPLKNPA